MLEAPPPASVRFSNSDASAARDSRAHADAVVLPGTRRGGRGACCAGATSTTCRSCRAAAAPASPAARCRRGRRRRSLERLRAGALVRPAAVADPRRGGRDDRASAAARARERAAASRPTRAPPSSRRSAATSRRTPAGRTPSSTASPALGDRARGRRPAGRARAVGGPVRKDVAGYDLIGPAGRLGGHARDRHGGLAAPDPAPRGVAPDRRRLPRRRRRLRGDARR